MKTACLFDEGKKTRAELQALGRSLRKRATPRDHAPWQPDPQRPDPVDILRSQEGDRVEELVPIRYGRMAASPFAFYRGAAAVMAWDLARTPVSGINVQACGDAHVDNFGVYASPERRLVFDINDFDETLPSPWEYDIKRMAVSVLLAARDQGWGDDVGVDSVRIAVRRYCTMLYRLSQMTTLDIHYAHAESSQLIEESEDPRFADALRGIVKKARKRTHLQTFRKEVTTRNGQLRFVEDPPLLVRLPDEEIDHFHSLFNRYRETLQDNRRHVLQKYRFRDAARKVVGVGSVGLRAYVILLQGRGDPDPLLVQVKQAVSSVLTPYAGRSGHQWHGQRVVVGQRLMQAISDPFLGWAPSAERDFYVRQLRDMKGQTGPADSAHVFEASMSLCGETLARAHARSVEPALLSGYLGKKGGPFVDSIVAFARAYADQSERDYERLVGAIRDGDVAAASL
ncbi:MAG: DUF2252 domain-containing protein [Halobacteria archaeon]|nr:DUF2252 domain-containing protein [Halobacteria archaeon]